jgi:hypothetical protein
MKQSDLPAGGKGHGRPGSCRVSSSRNYCHVEMGEWCTMFSQVGNTGTVASSGADRFKAGGGGRGKGFETADGVKDFSLREPS